MIDSKLLTIHDHISHRYSNQIKKLAIPLKDYLDITYFSYQRVQIDGRFNLIASSPHFLEYYLAKNFYQYDPFLVSPNFYKSGKNVFVINDDLSRFDDEAKIIIDEIERNFHFCQSLLFLTKFHDHMDIFVFSTSFKGREGMSKLLVNLDLLEKFIDHFYVKANKMIYELDEIGANIADIKGCDFRNAKDNAYSDNHIEINQREKFLEFISPEEHTLKNNMRNLSSRESECLYWMAQGKTADETACILKISKRTVECHRENCRKKIGAHYSFTNLLFLVGKYSLLN